MSTPSGHAPLVWFTSLAIAGAGIMAAASRHSDIGQAAQWDALAAGAVALGAGLLISTLHLGQWARAPLALRGAGRSALSHEVLLAGAALASGVGLLAMSARHAVDVRIGLAVVAINVLFLLSIGNVYRVRGQRTWGGATALLPLTTGLVCGETFVIAIGGTLVPDASAVWRTVSIDAMVFALGWQTWARTAWPSARRPIAVRRGHVLSLMRLLLFNVAPVVCLAVRWPAVAMVPVAIGLVLDRCLFYAAADQHTTEAELSSVEALIGRDARID
ncbi:MAG: DmsC/YnfH family molybdoenzyme membrane anchor subunit [Acidobacteriota bacterium]